MCTHFIGELNATQGLPIREISNDALAVLETKPWPGNIRQLRNTIERVLILGGDTTPIQAAELPSNIDNSTEQKVSIGASFAGLTLREAREVFEREYLVSQINRFGGNISKTAQFVGMERSALHRKLKLLNVETGQKSVS